MLEVMTMVDLVASTEASVLITGASGTGKELIAEAIHQKSHRAEYPFVKVNLGGIPTNLFESEMFGQKKELLLAQQRIGKVASQRHIQGLFF